MMKKTQSDQEMKTKNSNPLMPCQNLTPNAIGFDKLHKESNFNVRESDPLTSGNISKYIKMLIDTYLVKPIEKNQFWRSTSYLLELGIVAEK